MENVKDLMQKIKELKEKKRAVILAHLYQIEDVQDVADFVGDSLELSRKAAATDAEVIVFCGVKFMAETAKILSPDKTVLLPAIDAGCPMADMVEEKDVLQLKAEHPQAAVVCYVNSSAEVKAVSDYCCTSSNAVKLVQNIPEDEIIFVPDQNLGCFISQKVPEKKFIFWKGYCPTHHRINLDELEAIKKIHADVEFLVHPECKTEIVEQADFVGSTAQIIRRAKESTAHNVIIGTEQGVYHRLKRENPDKNIYLLSPKLICPNMKKTRLQDVFAALDEMKYQIEVEKEIREKALLALERMFQYS
ncbi:quinolinate synthase NadA [Bacillota bacterium LX-D]|nr:quinolinate synthase NadA [Bacillota bacterium LX-D]